MIAAAGGWPVSRIVIDLAVHLAALIVGAALAFIPDQAPSALAYFAVARLAYVAAVAFGLRAQSRRLGREPREVAEERHRVFNRRILRLQNIDAIAFGALCVATRWTMSSEPWDWAGMVAGILLIGVGVGTKTWAVRCLGPDSYTWHDFFVPREAFKPCRKGPYRYFKDPMYTIGYLQAYGFALAFGSWYGLVASLFAQATILIVNVCVEKPHFRRLCSVEPLKIP
ncbi:MAG TPA: PEMT/PEM2 methyltransferase family protein [Planctomycetota bacterium]|nr:PEMT/PEM2 methyltransferase family protein [Planctomycetota bacterium]